MIRFSIVIPVRNESKNIEKTSDAIISRLNKDNIDYEIILVDDNSTDDTGSLMEALAQENPRIKTAKSDAPHGFGLAVRKGLDIYTGDAVCVVMADLSDSPDDIVRYYDEIERGAECVFGSRFIRGSHIHDYPPHKLVINRLANKFIQMLFGLDHNDITNAFKCYRRNVIDGIRPILSHHFNLTVELPLKAIVRGFHHVRIPISWTNRTEGISKLKIKEMGSRYLFIVLYIFLERLLSKKDYHRQNQPSRIIHHDDLIS